MSTRRFGALWRAVVDPWRRRRAAEAEEADSVVDESGFTLIELMVVLLIMGILMAIAIPTFLGVTSSANDTSTQSNLTNAFTAAKAVYSKSDGWPSTGLVTTLHAGEPEFTYATTNSTTQKHISVYTSGTGIELAAYMTKTDVCWFIDATSTAASTVKYGGVYQATKGHCTASATLATSTGAKSGTKWPTIAGH